MSKKKLHYINAEKLYVESQHTVREIADKLVISEKTVRNWKKEGEWDNKRTEFLKEKCSFHSELYDFTRSLMKAVKEDLEKGRKVDSGRLYALGRLIPLFTKVKEYEKEIEKQGEKDIDMKELVSIVEKEVLKL